MEELDILKSESEASWRNR